VDEGYGKESSMMKLETSTIIVKTNVEKIMRG
jgi:hypothetical protein